MRDAIIRMEEVTKVFETEDMNTMALRGIDLSIYEGDYVSIAGPSGCGKSTLLSILGLLDLPTSGRYFIGDVDVTDLSLTEAAAIRGEQIGFVFQSFNLIDELSVSDNVALPTHYRRNNLSSSETKERVQKCLDRVEMSHRGNHKPNQLSGGQQQRIAIARALVSEPKILLVDEPTGNLDSKNSDIVMEMLSSLNSDGTTICLVTHDPRFADMATTRMHLLDGKLLDQVQSEVVA